MNYKYKICELVFCKFRGKWDIGRIEFCGHKCGMIYYDIKIEGAKRLQRKYECELRPMVEFRKI